MSHGKNLSSFNEKVFYVSDLMTPIFTTRTSKHYASFLDESYDSGRDDMFRIYL